MLSFKVVITKFEKLWSATGVFFFWYMWQGRVFVKLLNMHIKKNRILTSILKSIEFSYFWLYFSFLKSIFTNATVSAVVKRFNIFNWLLSVVTRWIQQELKSKTFRITVFSIEIEKYQIVGYVLMGMKRSETTNWKAYSLK